MNPSAGTSVEGVVSPSVGGAVLAEISASEVLGAALDDVFSDVLDEFEDFSELGLLDDFFEDLSLLDEPLPFEVLSLPDDPFFDEPPEEYGFAVDVAAILFLLESLFLSESFLLSLDLAPSLSSRLSLSESVVLSPLSSYFFSSISPIPGSSDSDVSEASAAVFFGCGSSVVRTSAAMATPATSAIARIPAPSASIAERLVTVMVSELSDGLELSRTEYPLRSVVSSGRIVVRLSQGGHMLTARNEHRNLPLRHPEWGLARSQSPPGKVKRDLCMTAESRRFS